MDIYEKYSVWGFDDAFAIAYTYHGISDLTMKVFYNWISKNNKRIEFNVDVSLTDRPLRMILNLFHAVLTNTQCTTTGTVVWFKQSWSKHDFDVEHLDITKVENINDYILRRKDNYIIKNLKSNLINKTTEKLNFDFKIIKTKLKSLKQVNSYILREALVRHYAKYKGINMAKRCHFGMMSDGLCYKNAFDENYNKLTRELCLGEVVADKLEYYSFHHKISYTMVIDEMGEFDLNWIGCNRYKPSTMEFVLKILKDNKWKMVELIILINGELFQFLTMLNRVALCEIIDGLDINISDVVLTGKNNKKIINSDFYYLLLDASENLDKKEGIYG